ncbi:hypothetical protein K432DRAFT_25994 [Lepidopterella palustris CBS 459.81]|uniref:Uncharacterized protein n=1 Tax=Lepidopterella palustris CBS 459.81 TaxID=1314670 RepID=A0A8E2ECB9_9PEZI|nr:hypothetical protein K432DRAFT_25994 [Lepidopterella palustris CBS 459.81]
MDTRHILPKNPCSTATTASLLDGAKMMGPEIIPGGSERCGDEELRRRGVFGLGWWKDAGCGDEVWNRCGDAGGEDLRHFAFCVHRIGKELV